MGGKSGGGMNAGPSLEYGDKALQLQKSMYNDTQGRTQPFYDTGRQGFNELASRLGLDTAKKSKYDLQQDDMLRSKYLSGDKNGGATGQWDKSGDVWSWNAVNGVDNDYAFDNTGYQKEIMDTYNAEDNWNRNAESPLLDSFSLDKFQEDPGYQFRMDEMRKEVERGAAARGQYYDPSTMKELQERGGNLADQTYGDAYNRYNNDQNNIFNRLAAVSGIGQTANNTMAQSGQNYASQGSQVYGQMGSAAQAAQNANNQPSMFEQLAGNFSPLYSAATGNGDGGLSMAMQMAPMMLSDFRLKENIKPVGVENGYQMYEFNYINVPEKTYRGVMAQDIEKILPDAVIEEEGVKKVNYGMLGVRMTEVN